MRKSLSLYAACLTIVIAGSYAFMEPLLAQRQPPNLDDMFISEDADSFDPGLSIGTQFPSIRALYQGQEITEIDEFFSDRGAIFIANRSVDW